jgi:hypothetical protein
MPSFLRHYVAVDSPEPPSQELQPLASWLHVYSATLTFNSENIYALPRSQISVP